MSKRSGHEAFADPGEQGSNGSKDDVSRNHSRKASKPRPSVPQVVKKSTLERLEAEKLPTLIYKEGEPLKELSRHLGQDGKESILVQVRIPAHCMSNSNHQVRARQLWGKNIYTEDSDLVAVLMHLGYYSQSLTSPPNTVAEVRAVVRPLPAQLSYPSWYRNGIRSRGWGAKINGCSYKVEGCWLVTRSGARVELEPSPEGAPQLTPTFIPAQLERNMTTRSSAAGSDRRQRMVQEVTIQYNLCDEPWLKYSMAAVADRGLKPAQWTSARLHKEVLYLETQRERFEVARIPDASNGVEGTAEPTAELYRFSRCATPLPMTKMYQLGLPLAPDQLEVLHASLGWEEFQWGPNGVTIKGESYTIVRIHFAPAHREA